MEAFTAALVILLALAFIGGGLYGLWLDYQQDTDPDLRAAGILHRERP